jgi:hypothetical protein
MMKLFVRFLLSLGFLLLGGHARTSQESTHGFPQHFFTAFEQTGDASLQSAPAFFTQGPASGHREINDLLADEEVEDDDDDDESKSSKKHPGTGNSISLIDQQSAANDRFIKSALPFCEHFSYTSALKFIIHCVIRI